MTGRSAPSSAAGGMAPRKGLRQGTDDVKNELKRLLSKDELSCEVRGK